ncbi:PilZ domain-containing protein [Xanthomonas maliensis]|uniref:PilZ domain-containing protein n=1 Tax=Xanthomonas maliensis TaxID=1321368 RepID=UPI00039A1C07|nr:PilZ domain-containing protein [Xanthomonas maliensis]KAB7762864.1 PilZ domain-containing protein [Xanthomonas maliensis]
MIQDTRRAPRRQPTDPVPVTDLIAETQIGRLGNISETGLLLLASAPLQADALYQLRFTLPERIGRASEIDVGVHLLWCEPAHAPGQSWAGFRFLTLSEPHRQRLRAWIGDEHLVG